MRIEMEGKWTNNSNFKWYLVFGTQCGRVKCCLVTFFQISINVDCPQPKIFVFIEHSSGSCSVKESIRPNVFISTPSSQHAVHSRRHNWKRYPRSYSYHHPTKCDLWSNSMVHLKNMNARELIPRYINERANLFKPSCEKPISRSSGCIMYSYSQHKSFVTSGGQER